MVHQVHSLSESSWAEVTGKWFLPSVYERVALQLGPCREILATLQASVKGTSLLIHFQSLIDTSQFYVLDLLIDP